MHDPYAPPAGHGSPDALRKAERDATVALVLASVSVFVGAPVLGPLAIAKAVASRRVVSTVRATLALVLAFFGCATSLFFWFLFVWQLLAP